jgi:hypothetical protein
MGHGSYPSFEARKGAHLKDDGGAGSIQNHHALVAEVVIALRRSASFTITCSA